MTHIRRILCPVDFSDFSRRALDYAYGLARWSGAEVCVLHVDPLVLPPVVAPGMTAPVPLDLPVRQERQNETADRLRAFATSGAEGIRIQIFAHVGDPVREILEQAATLEANLLVIGTHGRSGFERWMLGSTSAKLLRKSPCDVLTVPKLARGVGPETGPLRFRTIVCAVDFSERSRVAAANALDLAKETGAKIVPVHVVEDLAPETVRDLAMDLHLGDYLSAREREARRRLEELFAHAPRGRVGPAVIARGRPAPAIVHCAKDRDADLISMGSRGHRGVAGFFVGSTTEHVVRDALCPVLTTGVGTWRASGEDQRTAAEVAAGS